MQSKEQYEQFLETTLNQWSEKIDDLQTRAENEGIIGHFEELDVLRKKKQEALMRFGQLRESGENWQEHSTEMDETLNDLKAAFEQAESTIR
jgi:hypothetical protein